MRVRFTDQAGRRGHARLLSGLLAALVWAAPARAQTTTPAPAEEAPPPRALPKAAVPEELPQTLTLPDAIRWAIAHNPTLATVRMQRGIAAAGIVIAETYPFNPIIQDFIMGASGPHSAGITNRVFNEHTMRLDMEWRGQGKYRRAMAQAALSRTDWEIAAQEMLVAIQVVRAYNTALYRQEKLRVLEQMARLQEQVVDRVERLVRENQLPRTDLMLARADLADARAAVGPARSLMVVAWNDLTRLLGVVDGHYALQGTLELKTPCLPEADLVTEARERRPDLHALELAVREADERLGLEVANRFGNPSVGPAFEYNETSVSFIGLWMIWQAPVINIRRGEILQRQAEKARAIQAVRSLSVTLQQDVRTALDRLSAAEDLVKTFRTQTLPALNSTREGLDRLFAQGEPGVTLARVIAVHSRVLQTYSSYLDALFEEAQARADLAAAVADPFLAAAPPAPAVASAPAK